MPPSNLLTGKVAVCRYHYRILIKSASFSHVCVVHLPSPPSVSFAGDVICLSLKQPLLCNIQKPDLDYAAKNSIPWFKIRAELHK
jgi:hypothetical protein